MKKFLTTLASAISAVALTSCFQHEITVTLNKDGSGTVVEESLMGAAMLAMIGQFAAGLEAEGAEAQDPAAELLSEESANERAKELGEGVSVAKIEPIEVDGAKGARVTYAFTNINQLNVDLGSGMNSMGGGGEEDPDAPKKQNPIGFDYKDGKLTVKMPVPDRADAQETPAEAPDAQTQAMMKQMFADMKMGIKLAMAQGIAESDASYRDGDTITLMEMNFGKLIENPANFEKLAATQNEEDPAVMMAALKGIDGVKLEAKPEFSVTLK